MATVASKGQHRLLLLCDAILQLYRLHGDDVTRSSHVLWTSVEDSATWWSTLDGARWGRCWLWPCWSPSCCVAGWGRADPAVDPVFVVVRARWRHSSSNSTRRTCPNTRSVPAVCQRAE